MRSVLPIVTTLALVAALPAAAVPSPAPQQSRPEQLDAYVAQAVQDWEVPGLAIAVVKADEIVFARGYGNRELGIDSPVDENTLFAIGSTTKAMTAAIIGMLVDEGQLGWDDRVTDHLPGFELSDPYVTRELTVRDLLTHRAGLGNADMLWYRSELDAAEVVERARHIPMAYSLRAGFIYQNIMYATAGALIEAVTGERWDQVVRQRIFEPLGMADTVPLLAETLEHDNVAAPHYRIDGTVEAIENATVDSVAAAGSVWSSVRDMAQWMRLMLDEGSFEGARLLEPETHAELLRPQVIVPPSGFYPTARLTRPHWTTYALGWFQHDYRGRAVSFHTGSIDGMVAIIGLIPDEELGVYVLSNLDHAEVRHALMYKVFDLWVGTPSGRDWSTELRELYGELEQEAAAARERFESGRTAGTSPSHELDAYVGTYVDELYGELTIARATDGLELRMGLSRARLEHWHYDTFLARPGRPWVAPRPVTFELGTDGRIRGARTLGRVFDRQRD